MLNLTEAIITDIYLHLFFFFFCFFGFVLYFDETFRLCDLISCIMIFVSFGVSFIRAVALIGVCVSPCLLV